MPTTSLICPTCSKPLKINAAIPVGKAIKCPGCQNTFKNPGSNGAAAPAPPPKTTTARTAPTGKTVVGKKKEPAVTRLPVPSSPNGIADDDDFPVLTSRKKPRSKLPLLLTLFFLLLLAAGGVAAFVWPGYVFSILPADTDKNNSNTQGSATPEDKKKNESDKSDNKEPGKKKTDNEADRKEDKGTKDPGKTKEPPPKEVSPKDLLPKDLPPITDFTLLLPENTDMAVGVNFAGVGNAAFKKLALKGIDSVNEVPPAIRAFAQNVNFMSAAGNSKDFAAGPSFVVVQTARGNSIADVAALLKAKEEAMEGTKALNFGEGWLILPDPRSLAAYKSQSDLETALKKKSKLARASLLEQVNKVRGKTLWAVFSLDGNEQVKALSKTPPRDIPAADLLLPVLQGAKIATFTANLEDGSLLMELTFVCGNDSDAATGARVLKPLAEKIPALFLKLARERKEVSDQLLGAILKELGKIEIAARGADLTIALAFSKEVMSEALPLLEEMIPPPAARVEKKREKDAD